MAKPVFIARQASYPNGFLGWVVAQIMSRETGWENQKAIDLLELQPGQSALDVGCGHGASLPSLAQRVGQSRVAGIDPSPVMIGVARKKTKADTIEIIRSKASDMPFDDGAFDAVMSVHTIYFWDDPVQELREIRRVVAQDGRFVLGFRSTADERFIADSPQSVYHIRSLDDVETLLSEAGWEIDTATSDRARGALFHWFSCRPRLSLQ